MTDRRTILLWNLAAVAVLMAMAVLVIHRFRFFRPIVIQGAVMANSSDSNKELPIADVQIIVADGLAQYPTKSDASGLFRIALRPGVRRGHAITLQFRHPNYESLDRHDYVGDQLYVTRMKPIPRAAAAQPAGPATAVGNIRVRYSIKAVTPMNIGSSVKA